MFGYPRPGRETRPSVLSCVSPPVNPTPSTSDNSGVGYSNGRLHFGDRDGLELTTEQKEEVRLDLIRLLVNRTRDLQSTRLVELRRVENDDGDFVDSLLTGGYNRHHTRPLYPRIYVVTKEEQV